MRISHALAAAVAVSFLPAAALACEGEEKKQAIKMVSLDDAAKLQKDAKASFLDANNQETRAKYGVIPGATLLTNFVEYSTAELPKDKDAKLIFYCANTRCSASHKAAKRAVHAGYSDVNVLPDGIAGWKTAGKPVDVPRS
jgi:rhodanese-related sulfurtransferase